MERENQNENLSSNLIIYKTESGVVSVDTKNIELLFFDLERYNSQFSMGAMMARVLTGFMTINDEDDGNNTPLSISEEDSSKHANIFFIQSKHKMVLENLGLSLEPVYAGATMFTDGEVSESSRLKLNVSSGHNLVSFLQAVNEDNLKSNNFKQNLVSLSEVLTSQVASHYNFENMVLTPEMYELFANANSFVENYIRLGLSENVSQLSTYIEHGQKGDLREYILAERSGLFKKQGKNFGPADWQIDSSPSSLEARWKNAIKIVRDTKVNPNAQELSRSLSSHLLECIKYAITNLETITYLSEENKEACREILRISKADLEALS